MTSSAPLSIATQRHQGLMEALACLSGCALAVAAWYGLNMMIALTAI